MWYVIVALVCFIIGVVVDWVVLRPWVDKQKT